MRDSVSAIELMTDIMASKYKMKNCAAEARYYLDVRMSE